MVKSIRKERSLISMLYLYNTEDDGSVEKVFSWEPTTKQWWITGFNPEYAGEVDVHTLTSVGCIDMSNSEEMYEALTNVSKSSKEDKWDNMYTDDKTHTVWIC